MNITGNLFIIAMITYTVLFSGFVITGITISMFKHKSAREKERQDIIEQNKFGSDI